MTQPGATKPAFDEMTNAGLDVLLWQAVLTLAPLFMAGANGDETRARAAAKTILHAYKVASPIEIQLAVEATVFAYTAVETLHRVNTDKAMPEARRLRAIGSAVAQNRTAHRSRQALAALRKPPPVKPQRQPEKPPTAPDNKAPDFNPSPRLRDFMATLMSGGDFALPDAAASPSATSAARANQGQTRVAELTTRREARPSG